MTAAITCTATTRLSADECLARLAACPALPVAERMVRHAGMTIGMPKQVLAWNLALRSPLLGPIMEAQSTLPEFASADARAEWWLRYAAPLRKAREQRLRLAAMNVQCIGCGTFDRAGMMTTGLDNKPVCHPCMDTCQACGTRGSCMCAYGG